jgi:hypothetical protein
MATTMLGHMKESGSHNPSLHLKRSIEYILNPEKTENGKYVGAGNCLLCSAYENMLDTKELFHKKGGRQGYHFVISFPEDDEIDEKLCQQIIEEFAESYLQDQYEYVYAVHNNTDHLHAHLVFNSINRYDGKKYRYEKGDWAKSIQPITNQICKKYNLKQIAFETKNGVYITKRERIMEQVRLIKEASKSYFEFKKNLEIAGYVVKDKKYISVQLNGQGSKYRIGLHEDYISYFAKSEKNKSKEMQSDYGQRLLAEIFNPEQMKAYYEMQNLAKEKRRESNNQVWKYKKQLARLAKTQERIDYLFEYGINDKAQLSARKNFLENLYQELMKERHRIYRERYPLKEVIGAVEQLQLLTSYEQEYQNEKIYEDEHQAYKEAMQILETKGISYQEALQLRDKYENQLKDIKDKRKIIAKEIKVIKRIEDESRMPELESERQKKEIQTEKKQMFSNTK